MYFGNMFYARSVIKHIKAKFLAKGDLWSNLCPFQAPNIKKFENNCQGGVFLFYLSKKPSENSQRPQLKNGYCCKMFIKFLSFSVLSHMFCLGLRGIRSEHNDITYCSIDSSRKPTQLLPLPPGNVCSQATFVLHIHYISLKRSIFCFCYDFIIFLCTLLTRLY